jgi:hypothetical protein
LKPPHYLRNVTLGTGLTALFLLVRCSVPERDYTPLGIRENAGSGGGSGSGGDGTGGSSAGQAGLGGAGGQGDVGGQGGQAGAMPVVPVPCVEPDEDAGTTDAGADAGTDAGASADDPDAGSQDTTCECVDGFIRAVDADGDGEGTRACSVAPGLDCNDGDDAVTHNTCGGCSVLTSVIGDDCLDCGVYTCDGPDAVICASKPNPTVEDPDCRCVDAVIVARDTDADGQGTRLCEANPGSDCADGDNSFISNQCGGCESLPGAVGDACNQCGVYACNGTALACVPQVGAAGQQCLNTTTRQTCIGNGFWGNNMTCPNVCYEGSCETCIPDTFQCVPTGDSTQLYKCIPNTGSSGSLGIGWASYESCLVGETCDPNAGTCTGSLLLPRDQTFDVAPLQRGGLPWQHVLNTASDSDYG